jgi:cell division protein ZapA
VTDKKTVVTVTIGNEEYSLRSDRPPEYTRAVAEHVDRALKEVFQVGAMVETQKAAILAALSITDELFQARRSQTDLAEQLRAMTAELSRLFPPAKRRSRG